jgi:hypothetical protein
MKLRLRLFSLLACLLALVPMGCGSSSPSDVVRKALAKANEGNYSTASEFLTAEARKKEIYSKDPKKFWDTITSDGTIKEVEIIKEEVRGEGATVELKITYKDGETVKVKEELVKEGGSWKAPFHETWMATIERGGLEVPKKQRQGPTRRVGEEDDKD